MQSLQSFILAAPTTRHLGFLPCRSNVIIPGTLLDDWGRQRRSLVDDKAHEIHAVQVYLAIFHLGWNLSNFI